ncbi:universal stress protein [Rhodococcus sp. 06-156-3C]|uniref:universal stress protein n=1 Tax=Nocardiaceae TaxID=85025 RepID=UPI000523096C|nr:MULTISPECIES: universal stress protein [Rhodococcus]OZD08762.1 universal stress protein [Rhodococcus sp. 06-156-4C]OZD17339.1 universal stress protein [Rhodococcus sp. 06-156-3C]OZD18676.1 universal stress protein [Rhodococcus sp. 06-156-4a]OZD25083.1 universal stress protein [Rhodococcus sp. 06-156-3b]OZD34242.1 universal stress protein [Rhodococcus sp. 06-156-3]
MSVLVAYSDTPEGRAALRHGHRLANSEETDLVAFDLDNFTTNEDRSIDAPVVGFDDERTVRWIGRHRDDPDAADELLDTSEEIGAQMIVLGIRRRSAVGKLLLGSNAQRILMGADVPVLAVKAEQHDH